MSAPSRAITCKLPQGARAAHDGQQHAIMDAVAGVTLTIAGAMIAHQEQHAMTNADVFGSNINGAQTQDVFANFAVKFPVFREFAPRRRLLPPAHDQNILQTRLARGRRSVRSSPAGRATTASPVENQSAGGFWPPALRNIVGFYLRSVFGRRRGRSRPRTNMTGNRRRIIGATIHSHGIDMRRACRLRLRSCRGDSRRRKHSA
jgi:hypothetical protein